MRWGSAPARRVLRALERIGWQEMRSRATHPVLRREGWADFIFSFHMSEEIGPVMLARIAKRTGLRPEDLQG